jgi:hypothetical protein
LFATVVSIFSITLLGYGRVSTYSSIMIDDACLTYFSTLATYGEFLRGST